MGDVVVVRFKFTFRSLKTERSEDRAMQRALAEESTTECDEGSNPVEYSESLAPSFFFLGKATHVSKRGTQFGGCARARFVYFSKHRVAVGKRRKVKTTKKQQPTAQTSGVHNDQHRAVCTLHSTL